MTGKRNPKIYSSNQKPPVKTSKPVKPLKLKKVHEPKVLKKKQEVNNSRKESSSKLIEDENFLTDLKRLIELHERNSRVPLSQRTSYPVELQVIGNSLEF